MPTTLAQITLVKYTILAEHLGTDYIKANFYAKFSNDPELTLIGYMTGSYSIRCIGNDIGIKVCLIHAVLGTQFYATDQLSVAQGHCSAPSL